MANTYFKFKQFTIEQKACANKVSTDACVFGAFMAKLIRQSDVLDIGAGSALLSLMMAQGKAKQITGIEIEENCFIQAQENTSNSPFKNKIELHCADARTWKNNNTFDYIISNPPFFNNSSKNKDAAKNIARQTESLSPIDWKQILTNNAHSETEVFLLLSNNDVLLEYENELSDYGFSNQHKTLLFDKQNVDCKRVILHASANELTSQLPSTFIYKKQDGTYTIEFIELLQDFYLYL